jgi:hypothetical protein
MAVGLVVTVAALAGYFAMAHSPMEGAPVQQFFSRVWTQIRTGYNPAWILGGLVTGPLFGLLGQRWRVARSWISAGLVVGALCLEPLARGVAGMLYPPPVVWGVEMAVGIAVGVAFAVLISTSRRQREARAPLPPAG